MDTPRPEGQIRVIGVIKNWPDKIAAEHETIERMKVSASLAGFDLVEVDTVGKTAFGVEPEIVLSLHFETPKTWRQPSIHPLWNPVSFLAMRDFPLAIFNSSSHTFLASGGENLNDQKIDDFRGLARNEILPQIMPSLDGPLIEPRNLVERSLFYVGVNWERLKGSNRFNALLKKLDEFPFMNIYGPAELFGVKVWRDFKSYRAEIPFDGKSLLTLANQHGVYLCLSSDAHVDANLLSNRIFEAAASGSLIIANRHRAAEEFFGDSILWLQSSDEETMADEVEAHMSWANSNPEESLLKAQASQLIFRETLLLSKQFAEAISVADGHIHRYQQAFKNEFTGNELARNETLNGRWRGYSEFPSGWIEEAIGKIIIKMQDSGLQNHMAITPWIAQSPQMAVKLVPHNVNRCDFCNFSIGFSNVLYPPTDTFSSTPKSFEGFQFLYGSEPIYIHKCNANLQTPSRERTALKSLGLVRISPDLLVLETPTFEKATHTLNRKKKAISIHADSAVYRLAKRIFSYKHLQGARIVAVRIYDRWFNPK
jgi:hypothetical protein